MRGSGCGRLVCGPGATPSSPLFLHEPLHTLAIHGIALAIQPHHDPATAVKGRAGILSINQVHQLERLLTFSRWMVIPIGTTQPQQLTLATKAQFRMARDNPLAFGFNRAWQFFLPSRAPSLSAQLLRTTSLAPLRSLLGPCSVHAQTAL